MNFKKPKFWDLKKTNFVSKIFLPFTIFLRISNFLLNTKIKKKNSNIQSICVGNIYIGGTGKTPSTIKLYEIFQKLNFNVCAGKKFYSNHIDEEKILKKKTSFISGKNRLEIMEKAIEYKKELIIFDDGLQDKNLDFDLKIVCFDAENWIGNGQLIPSGPLRETIDSLKKYDVVFLKNQSSDLKEINEIIKINNPNIKIFLTDYRPINLNKFDKNQKYLIFSGIGNPESFKKSLIKNNFKIVKEIIFPDHYEYKNSDIDKIKMIAKEYNAKIITTEKDFVKMSVSNRKNIDFLEIDLMINKEAELINFIKKRLNEKN